MRPGGAAAGSPQDPRAASGAEGDGGWPARWQQLLQRLERVDDAEGLRALLDRLAHPAEPRMLAFANAHALNLAARDAAFHQRLAAADLLLRDGSGMAALMRFMGQPPGLNLNGTDLIPQLLRRQAGVPGACIALFGTREPWLSLAQVQVMRLAPGARCITADGFRPTEDYVRLAGVHAPRLIVLGMGMPRQEEVALALRAAMWDPCLIVCGGALLDFLGGRFPRAPLALQRAGLEWTWRLAREPRRLFRRYVLGNPVFLARALCLAARGRQAAAP